MSWFFSEKDLAENLVLKDKVEVKNKMGVCQCPGKKLAMGRDGKAHNRNIFADVEHFRVVGGVTLVVCLLNDSELRHLGLNVKDYKLACEKAGVRLHQHPIIEMAPPDDLDGFRINVIKVITSHLKEGDGNIVVHCRGGVGRAGLVACCVLSELCKFPDTKAIIDFVRRKRDKRCVESRKQEDFVAKYFSSDYN